MSAFAQPPLPIPDAQLAPPPPVDTQRPTAPPALNGDSPLSAPQGFLSPQPAKAAAPKRDTQVQPGEQLFLVIAPQSKIKLRHLDTRVLELSNRIKVVDGFDQEKVAINAMSPHRVRLYAENPGVTTVKLVDEFDNSHVIEVFVEPDTRELEAYLERLFPASSIEVVGIREGVVLRGWVTEPAHIPQIMEITKQFYEIVHPQLTVAGPNQVKFFVKVIEVQRSKLRELGFNFLLTGQQFYLNNSIGGLAPLSGLTAPFGGPPVPMISPTSLPNSEMSFAITGNNAVFQGFIHALQAEGLAKIMAEPILVTTSGRPATVHSGGEFPVLVPQSFGNLSIEWREFGVKLEAVPIVLGEGRLRLDLAPEVSERDFSNSVSINGMVVPGINSRSVNTQVEMRFGETLMIGGLISSRNQGTTQKIPFLGELPLIGAAFSRKSYTMGETELVILVTPQMVAPMASHQVPAAYPGSSTTAPIDRELYLDGLLEVPNYGPDCPGCETSAGFMINNGATQGVDPECGPDGLPIQPTYSKNVKAVSPQIQQASGVKDSVPSSATSGEVKSIQRAGAETADDASVRSKLPAGKPGPSPQTAKPKTSASEIQPATETVEVNKFGDSRPKSSIFESRTLPGMIAPKPGAKESK
ncbi:hypothetical protein SH668x_001673 [Planctomicrobium sp. SH668]|uniref:type II and III secretion system protein family protein n=1 Tax=Planctomicrobium sp. SH668 TaxID=3448126 RepID=UPI003F5BAE41